MVATIRALGAGDHDAWAALYSRYAAFYEVEQTDEMRTRVWSWLQDDTHEVRGLVAEHDGALVGFAHFREFARPLAAAKGLYLDDLFVSPDARGAGAASGLIMEIEAEAKSTGCSVIRWITADDNYRARGVYDRLAERTMWITYDRVV